MLFRNEGRTPDTQPPGLQGWQLASVPAPPRSEAAVRRALGLKDRSLLPTQALGRCTTTVNIATESLLILLEAKINQSLTIILWKFEIFRGF